jgi:hypothetical protein
MMLSKMFKVSSAVKFNFSTLRLRCREGVVRPWVHGACRPPPLCLCPCVLGVLAHSKSTMVKGNCSGLGGWGWDIDFCHK